MQTAIERHVATGADNLVDILRRLDPVGEEAGKPQHLFGDAAHRHLPWIEFAELAAHRDENNAAEAAIA